MMHYHKSCVFFEELSPQKTSGPYTKQYEVCMITMLLLLLVGN